MKTDLKDYLKNKEGFIVVFMSGGLKRVVLMLPFIKD